MFCWQSFDPNAVNIISGGGLGGLPGGNVAASGILVPVKHV